MYIYEYIIYIYMNIYIYIYIYIICDYLCEISLKANVATDEGNGRNERDH